MTEILTNSKAVMMQALADATPETSSKIFDALNKSIGIFCLSEKPDSELMWSHYADSHQGFVIEFETECSFFNQRRSEVDELRHIRK
ncbi:hypothetical protein PSTG_19467, partial [Puccinia striiformis f. sp. tritici PST-78]